MNKSTLFQRLLLPTGRSSSLTPFTFGAGGAGLSQDADRLLAPILSFDYMGRAEYEFGAVANALHYVAKNAKDFEAFVVEISMSHVAKHWRELIKTRGRNGEPKKTGRKMEVSPDRKFPAVAKVFVFCHKDHRLAVENTVHLLASGRDGTARDAVSLNYSLRPHDEYDLQKVGWLELDNGYFIFVNVETWKQVVELFKGGPDADVRQQHERVSREIQSRDRKNPEPFRSHSVRPRVGRGPRRSRVLHPK